MSGHDEFTFSPSSSSDGGQVSQIDLPPPPPPPSQASSSTRFKSLSNATSATSLTDTEKNHCTIAANYFNAQDYSSCLDCYAQLLNDSDFAAGAEGHRLRHNLLVAGFMKNGCTGVDAFYGGLKEIQEAVVEEETVISFNLAVLYFHHKQYQNTLRILDKLVNELRRITSSFSTRVKLLYIETFIRLQLFDDKALMEIECLESQYLAAAAEEDSEFDFKAGQRRLKQMKILCLLGINSLAAAKRELKALLADGGTSTQEIIIASHLKAQLEFWRGNFKKSLKLLTNLKEMNVNSDQFWSTGDNLDLILSNNLGCLYYSMGKPNVGCTHFGNAAAVCDLVELKDKKRQPLHCRAYNKKYEILYNLGIGILHLNQSSEQVQQAYLLLSFCRRPFYSNPRLWLRLAEACIKIHAESRSSHGGSWEDKNRRILHLLKESLKTVPGLFRRMESDWPTYMQLPGPAQDVPRPTLAYAHECIAVALHLIETHEERKTESPSPAAGAPITARALHVPPSRPITCTEEISRLHASILCTGAYICCLLRKYNLAISYCTRLLHMKNVPPGITFFANMYLGEALFKQSKVEEALGYLGKATWPSMPPGGEEWAMMAETRADEESPPRGAAVVNDLGSLYKTDPWTVDTVILYNRLVVLVNSGNLDTARQHLEAWMRKMAPRTPPTELLLLLVDIYMKQGNLEQARALTQQFAT